MENLLVALVGGLISGVAVAAIAGLVNLVTQRRDLDDREAARADVRERERIARIHDRRAQAYEQILEHMARLSAAVDRSDPILGFGAPPRALTDDELFHLTALVYAYTSPEARDLAWKTMQAGANAQVATAKVAADKAAGRPIDQHMNDLIGYQLRMREGLNAFTEKVSEELRS